MSASTMTREITAAVAARRGCTLLVGAVLLAAACGHKADPLPPLQVIPAATRDLTLRQQGEVMIFRLAYPRTTATGDVLPGLEALEVWSLEAPEGSAADLDARSYGQLAERLLEITGPELSSSVVGDRIETRFRRPQELEEGKTYVFATRTRSTTGEASEFSNLIALPVAPPPEAPRDLELEPTAEGIRLRWSRGGDQVIGYHVYRRLAAERRYGPPLEQLPASDDEPGFLDRSARFDQRYLYSVSAVASADPLVESTTPVEREILYEDRFAPAPPDSLIALAEDGRVRLILERSPSADVTGYWIYRRDPGSDTFRRIAAEPLAGLETVDRGLTAGLTFQYHATAVDGSGNEGEPTRDVSVTLP